MNGFYLKRIAIYFNFTGRVQGDKAILPKNYFTEGARDSFWAENLTSVSKLLCLTNLPGKLKYIVLSTVVIISKLQREDE